MFEVSFCDLNNYYIENVYNIFISKTLTENRLMRWKDDGTESEDSW